MTEMLFSMMFAAMIVLAAAYLVREILAYVAMTNTLEELEKRGESRYDVRLYHRLYRLHHRKLVVRIQKTLLLPFAGIALAVYLVVWKGFSALPKYPDMVKGYWA